MSDATHREWRFYLDDMIAGNRSEKRYLSRDGVRGRRLPPTL